MKPPSLTIVVAVAKNGVIGAEGVLPWRLSSDMKRFKAATMGKPVLMGRKTWDSLAVKPLPGRPNLVLSRDRDFRAAGGFSYSKLDAFLAAGRAMAEESGAAQVCVIGGALLYAQTLPLADQILLTEVDLEPEGDAVFPEFDRTTWLEISRDEVPRGPKDDAAFVVRALARR